MRRDARLRSASRLVHGQAVVKRDKGHAVLLLMFVTLAMDEYGYTSERDFIRDCRAAFRLRSR